MVIKTEYLTNEDINDVLERGIRSVILSKKWNDKKKDEADMAQLLPAVRSVFDTILKKGDQLDTAVGFALISQPVIDYLGIIPKKLDTITKPEEEASSKKEVSSEKWFSERYGTEIWRAIKCAAGMIRYKNLATKNDYHLFQGMIDVIWARETVDLCRAK
jgi:hypothetical protein